MMELITGGSGSGKSAWAESRVCQLRRKEEKTRSCRVPLYYIATMFPGGKETEKKINNHRQMRAGKGFTTLEWYLDFKGQVRRQAPDDLREACVLVECMSNLTANEMYMDGGAGERAVEQITEGIRLLKETCRHLVIVTNEVFSESGTDSGEMRKYKENLGRINRMLAEKADRVTEVVWGIPCTVKGAAENRPKEDFGKGSGKMKMVVGGAFQGKRTYADTVYPGIRWIDGADCPLTAIDTFEGMDHFHIFVRRWMEAGRGQTELLEKFQAENTLRVIICDETGCGLVPVDAFERACREAVGRICTALAEKAERVDRVICGIGTRIK